MNRCMQDRGGAVRRSHPGIGAIAMLLTWTGIALAPAGLEGQGRAGAEMARDRAPGALERLLEHRDALGLTAQQISQLEDLQTHVREAQEALRERRDALRPDEANRGRMGRQRPGGAMGQHRRGARDGAGRADAREARERIEEMREELAPLAEELRRRRAATMLEVGAILTPEQRAQLPELLSSARRSPRSPGTSLRQ